MGAFIVFEGGEGAGKSTQARLLSRRLSRDGYNVVYAREPGGSALGETVRRWLKTRLGLAPLTELFLFSAARAQLVEEVIAPALSGQGILVCDRFTASTLAYQGYGRGLDLDLIRRLNQAATRGIEPDLTVFLDVPIEAGLARKGNGTHDNFESEALEFHRRVKDGYLALAASDEDRWLVLDGTQGKSVLASRIRERAESLVGPQK